MHQIRSSFIFLASILVASIIVFSTTLSTYFSQDDWVFLSHVYKQPFSSVWNYYPEAFYRPVGQQLFFWINSRMFGLNPVGYHVLALSIHALNTILLWSVFILSSRHFERSEAESRNLAKRSGMWLLLVAFYSFHPVHLIAFNWLTQIDIEIAAMFALLTILFFQKAIETKRSSLLLASCFLFLAALLSHETAAMVPVVLWFKGRSRRTPGPSLRNEKGPTPLWRGRTFRNGWILLLIISGVVLSAKYLLNPFPFQSDYALAFHPLQLLSTIKWYALRALYLPEGVRQFPQFAQILSIVSAAFLVAAFRLKLIKGLIVFVLVLFPVLFLSRHAFSVYAVIPMLMMTIELARQSDSVQLGRNRTALMGILLFMTSFFISHAVTPTHWTTTRGEISRKLTEQFLGADPASRSDLSSLAFPADSEPSFASMQGRQFEVLEP